MDAISFVPGQRQLGVRASELRGALCAWTARRACAFVSGSPPGLSKETGRRRPHPDVNCAPRCERACRRGPSHVSASRPQRVLTAKSPLLPRLSSRANPHGLVSRRSACRWMAATDGYVSEGISDVSCRSLADQWSSTPWSDQGLIPFLIRHIDATCTQDDLQAIVGNAQQCPKNRTRLCTSLVRAAKQAMQ